MCRNEDLRDRLKADAEKYEQLVRSIRRSRRQELIACAVITLILFALFAATIEFGFDLNLGALR